MKRLLLALTLSSAGQAFAQGLGAPPPVPAEAPKTPTTFIAKGEEVEIPNLGFSVTPPVDWEVIRNGSGASLLFQAPKPEEKPGVVTYQANIRVMAFDDPRPMDDITKEEFNKIILDKNSTISSRVSNYLIRSAEKVQLANGTNAYLYYAEFMFDTTPTMQMHILVSNAHHHFLMTYTDLASVFEASNSTGLATAYTSMQNVKLDSVPPDRFTQYYYIGGGVLAFFFLLLVVRIIRGQKMKRLGERIESEDGSESTSYGDGYTGVSEISEIAVRAKPKKRPRDEYEDETQESELAARAKPKKRPRDEYEDETQESALAARAKPKKRPRDDDEDEDEMQESEMAARAKPKKRPRDEYEDETQESALGMAARPKPKKRPRDEDEDEMQESEMEARAKPKKRPRDDDEDEMQESEMAVRAKPKKRPRDDDEDEIQEENHDHSYDHDDDEMPKTTERTAPSTRTTERQKTPSAPAPKPASAAWAPEARAPTPVAKPAPSPVVAKPKPQPTPAPAARVMPSNSPAPKPANFEARTRKASVNIDETPPPEVSAVSSAWDLGDIQPIDTKQSLGRDQDDDEQDDADEVVQVYSEPAVKNAAKSRHQSSKPREKEPEMDLEESNVALISDILPNAGEPKKKKSLFSWGKSKKKDKDDDDFDGSASMTSADLDADDDWDKGSKKKVKDKGYKDDEDEPVVKPKAKAQSVTQAKSSSNVKTSKEPESEMEGWNLADTNGSPDADDEED